MPPVRLSSHGGTQPCAPNFGGLSCVYAQRLPGLFAVLGFRDAVARSLQHLAEDEPDALLVVGDQNVLLETRHEWLSSLTRAFTRLRISHAGLVLRKRKRKVVSFFRQETVREPLFCTTIW